MLMVDLLKMKLERYETNITYCGFGPDYGKKNCFLLVMFNFVHRL